MTITLDEPLDRTEIISEVTVLEYNERPPARIVKASVQVGSSVEVLTLWEGAAYDAIGQWTDSNASARIKELLE